MEKKKYKIKSGYDREYYITADSIEQALNIFSYNHHDDLNVLTWEDVKQMGIDPRNDEDLDKNALLYCDVSLDVNVDYGNGRDWIYFLSMDWITIAEEV